MEFSISGILAVLFVYANIYYMKKIISTWGSFCKFDLTSRYIKRNTLKIKYLKYLKVGYFVIPRTYFRYICRNVKLYSEHTSKEKESTKSMREMIGDILLESVMVIYYQKIRVELHEKIVEFKWTNFPVINNAGEYYTCKVLHIDVSLESKSMVKAVFDNRNISPQDTFILLCFHSLFLNRANTKQLSNVDHDSAYFEASVIQYMVSIALPMFACLPKRSLLPPMKGRHELFVQMLHHYYYDQPRDRLDYQHLVHLVEHSNYVRFVWNTHTKFMNTYHDSTSSNKYVEALFAQRILQPLESVNTANILRRLTRISLETLDFEFLIHVAIYLHPNPLITTARISEADEVVIRQVLEYGKKVNSTLAGHIDTY